jgi:hypothetical protein
MSFGFGLYFAGDLEGPQSMPKKAKKVKKKAKIGALSFNVDEEEEEDC